MTDLDVAKTMIAQLGHSTGRLSAMIGARDFVAGSNSVSFRFAAKATNGANACRIVLDPSDTYTVEFLRCRKAALPKVVGSFSDVYAEDLTGLFERETGLYLSL